MAGLSSKAAEALTKIMSRMMLDKLASQANELKVRIAQEEQMAKGRDMKAASILSVEKYVDGTEIWPKGDMFHLLVDHLDEAGLRSALTIVESRTADLKRQESAYLVEDRIAHERTAPGVRYRPDIGRFDR